MVRGKGRNKGHVHNYKLIYTKMKLEKGTILYEDHYRCDNPGKCYRRKRKERRRQ